MLFGGVAAGQRRGSPAAQAATNGAVAPNGDDHAKAALELGAYGQSGATACWTPILLPQIQVCTSLIGLILLLSYSIGPAQ